MSNFHESSRDLNQTRTDFLATELSLGLTFAAIALDSTDEAKTKRNCKNARTAYDAILKFIGTVTLTPADSLRLAAGMERLKSQLLALGETF
jgi:hypothetical protein